MNRWVVICERESFPFSAPTPFPAGRVFLLWQLHFLPQSLFFFSHCLRSLAGVLPTGSKCWSEAGTSVQNTFIFQIASSDTLSGQCQAGRSLYTINAVQLGGSSGVLLFQGVFSCATFNLFFPQHN